MDERSQAATPHACVLGFVPCFSRHFFPPVDIALLVKRVCKHGTMPLSSPPCGGKRAYCFLVPILLSIVCVVSTTASLPQLSWGRQRLVGSRGSANHQANKMQQGCSLIWFAPLCVEKNKNFALLRKLRGGESDVVQEESVAATAGEDDNTTSTEQETQEDDASTDSILSEEEPNPWIFTCCKEGDGSESDPDGLPRRFLKMQKENREKAIQALNATLSWREEHDVDTILSRPHGIFDVCKCVVPHYFGGRDPTNHVVFIQRPGLLNLQMAKDNNLTMEELLFHYVYVLEYCWNIQEPTHDSTMTSIIDLTGINFGVLTKGEMMNFVKQFVQMMSSHYPSRSYKTLLLNTPRWFGAIYKLISPMLRESTRAKIQICSKGKKQDEVLSELLGSTNVPKELLCVKPKEDEDTDSSEQISDMERDLRAFCTARLEEAGVEMKTVLT